MKIHGSCFKASVLVLCFSLFFSGAATALDLHLPAGPPLPADARFSPAYGTLAEYEQQLSQTTQDGATPIPPDQSPPSLLTYGREFFPDLAGSTKRMFSKDILPVALVGTVLAAAVANIDHEDKNVKTYFQTRRPLDGISKYGDQIGEGYYHVAVGAALLGIGELSDNKHLADTGVVTLEALLLNGIATEGLKYAAHRKRPNGGDNMSFPSGHTSSTATLAASISAMYNWDPKIAIPLYSVVVFVGASRIQDNMHYLSDVLAGLTLGTVIGMSTAKYHQEKDAAARNAIWNRISVSPVFEGDLRGAVFNMKW